MLGTFGSPRGVTFQTETDILREKNNESIMCIIIPQTLTDSSAGATALKTASPLGNVAFLGNFEANQKCCLISTTSRTLVRELSWFCICLLPAFALEHTK